MRSLTDQRSWNTREVEMIRSATEVIFTGIGITDKLTLLAFHNTKA